MQNTLNKSTPVPNPKQQECIDSIKGKIMVLAGPGTGKTFTLINRIKAMIKSGIEPKSILALAYSNAAAAEMKERLVTNIGTKAAGVCVHTYHSFCMDLIKIHPSAFSLMEGFRLVDETSKRNILTETLDSLEIKYYRTKVGEITINHLGNIFKSIERIKKKKITREEFFEGIKNHPDFEPAITEAQGMLDGTIPKGRKQDKTLINKIESTKERINKAVELWQIYEKYKNKLRENNFIDFDDMINFVLDAFCDNKALLDEVASEYKYLLVDEYQDTNPLQNELLFNLLEAMDEKNIFVVGDDDQIIYEFQGADKNNLENFLSKFPDTKVICLNENNRSTKSILDLSYGIIRQDEERIENNPNYKNFAITKRLEAKNVKINALDKKPRLNIFSDAIAECNYIVDDIEKLINSSNCPIDLKTGEKNYREIAILCRQNAPLNIYGDMLKSKNIPYQIYEGKNIFTINSVITTYFYLKTLESPQTHYDKLFALLLSPPFNFNHDDYTLLIEKWRLNHKDFITNIKDMLNDTPWVDKARVEGFLNTYEQLKKFKAFANPKSTVIEVINETGILAAFLESKVNKVENITGLKTLIDEAESLQALNPTVTVSDFVKHLDNALENGINISTAKSNTANNAVQLITYHNSKGREFEYVYLPNLTANEWESKRAKAADIMPFDPYLDDKTKKQIKLSSQLKLLFVGITRAKHSLTLSYANTVENVPQQFTSYISNLETDFEVNKFEFSDEQKLEQTAKTISSIPYWKDTGWRDYISQKAHSITLSPSSLNEFLNCQRQFFYSHILELKQKDGNWDRANYGSAVHRVLENAINRAKENGGIYQNVEETIEEFKNLIEKTSLTSKKTREEYLERGEKHLRKYYPKFIETPAKNIVATEFELENLNVEFGVINGKIDRIEKFSDGTYGLYDYKTGSSKSKNALAEGKAYEHYLNQLRFYKYAYEKQTGVKVSDVGLIFPEDFEGNVHMCLDDYDNKVIEQKIQEAFKKIKALDFEAPKQTKERCKYCPYMGICTLDAL